MTAAMKVREPVSTIELAYRAEDLPFLPSELARGTVHYELDNGRLITMSPPGNEHGAVESNISTALKIQGEFAGKGKVRVGEVAIVLWRDPDRVVGADVLFVCNDSLPIRQSPEGYLETIPELVVEVVSKNDTQPYVMRKVQDYLEAGVRVVMVAHPARRTVHLHRANRDPEVFGEGDTILVPDVLPGFELTVEDAFRL